jgi:predicted RNase H-like HicB family nuclease/uncharacterized damage-inducible protein DinB
MVYDVYLLVKRSGRTHAHVPDLPGCNWLASSPEEAWRLAPEAIRAHLGWLRKHDQPAPSSGEPIFPRLAQQHRSTAREGNLIGYFECERRPVSRKEIPAFLELMACARTDLLEPVRELPDEVLNWQPASDSWSIQEVLRHVAGAERWYLTRILDPVTIPHFKPSKSVWQRLETVRAVVLERLARLNQAERSMISADESGELWSARKVFRRYLEHEREHTAHIHKILALVAADEKHYYTARSRELLAEFEEEASRWKPVLLFQYGQDTADGLLREARAEFIALLPQLPYIGGDENQLTASLVESAQYLALYKAMKKQGKSAAETGKVLYDAEVARIEEPRAVVPVSVTREQLMDRRRRRAERSQERRYPGDYVYELIAGDGVEFDYGYDFSECAAHKLYHAQQADEFTPFYCYLDFPKSTMGLRRTMTLSEGDTRCNHRFKEGRKSEHAWPPPFLKRG